MCRHRSWGQGSCGSEPLKKCCYRKTPREGGKQGREGCEFRPSTHGVWLTSDQGKEAGPTHSLPMATWGNITFQALLDSLGGREVKQL